MTVLKYHVQKLMHVAICFYYSLALYNEWIIVRAMISDGTERQSAMTMLTFKIQVESHLMREPKPPT